MTREEKRFLLRVVCSMLCYDIIGEVDIIMASGEKKGVAVTLLGVNMFTGEIQIEPLDDMYAELKEACYTIEDFKPYLRPMSSMTKEEMKEYYDGYYTDAINLFTIPNPQKTDWLNAHYFDYRGLIPMGLALEAPEGIYVFVDKEQH